MKKVIAILFFIGVSSLSYGQKSQSIFGRDPIINLENFQQKKVYYGFYLVFNSFDFKSDYKSLTPDILVKKTTGFNVGIIDFMGNIDAI